MEVCGRVTSASFYNTNRSIDLMRCQVPLVKREDTSVFYEELARNTSFTPSH